MRQASGAADAALRGRRPGRYAWMYLRKPGPSTCRATALSCVLRRTGARATQDTHLDARSGVSRHHCVVRQPRVELAAQLRRRSRKLRPCSVHPREGARSRSPTGNLLREGDLRGFHSLARMFAIDYAQLLTPVKK